MRQWEDLNKRCGDAGVSTLFHLAFDVKEIVKQRALVRKLTYMEIMYHRWPGETERAGINYRIMEGMWNVLAKGDGDKLLLGLGWADVVATDLWPVLSWKVIR